MKKLTFHSSDSELFAFVNEWITALSVSDFLKACEMLGAQFYEPWTPATLQDTLFPEEFRTGGDKITPYFEMSECNNWRLRDAAWDLVPGCVHTRHETHPISVNRWSHRAPESDLHRVLGDVRAALALNREWSTSDVVFLIHQMADYSFLELQTLGG
jgi:hypothetical protein